MVAWDAYEHLSPSFVWQSSWAPWPEPPRSTGASLGQGFWRLGPWAKVVEEAALHKSSFEKASCLAEERKRHFSVDCSYWGCPRHRGNL